MRYTVGCDLEYRIKSPTTLLLNVEAARLDRQTVLRETLRITPQAEPERWVMPEAGNRFLRFRAEPGTVRIAYEADVELDPVRLDPDAVREVDLAELPLHVMVHTYPSRFCQSDKLSRFAQRQFGDRPAGHQRVTAICNWIHDNVDYVRGSSDETTSAFDVVTERAGVCRDFAHLGIALCRALGIPARYVSAYAWRLQPPDFHGVFEAWLQGPQGGGWYLFDPTRMAAADGLVRIGVGRDAGDVGFASIFGQAESGKPEVRIRRAEPDATPSTTEAVMLSAA